MKYNYTIRYSSSRAELWQWYWRTWRKSLWRIHAAAAIILGFVLSGSHLDVVHLTLWLAYTLLSFPMVVAAFAAFPQLKFKSQERILQAGQEGWASQIGRMSGSRMWSEVASIDDEAGTVVIRGINGNALVVPARAFISNKQRQQFVKDIREWHNEKC